MIVHNFDPILVDFGIIQIRWYSRLYLWNFTRCGMEKILIKQIQNQKNYFENFDDLIGYLIIGIIIGGRLGYVLFYNPSYYFNNLFEVFKI